MLANDIDVPSANKIFGLANFDFTHPGSEEIKRDAAPRRVSLFSHLHVPKRSAMKPIVEDREKSPIINRTAEAILAQSMEIDEEPEDMRHNRRHSDDRIKTRPSPQLGRLGSPSGSPGGGRGGDEDTCEQEPKRKKMKLRTVKGSFSVETTTLKPKRSVRAEIERVLQEENVEYKMDGVTFNCKIAVKLVPDLIQAPDKEPWASQDPPESSPSFTPPSFSSWGNGESGTPRMSSWDARDDICWLWRVKFEIEICRVGGMEMLLGLSFRRIEGSVWAYKELCQKLLSKMKL